MAGKKNEILLSIALEGDSEIKKKLEDIGKTGKDHLGNVGKHFDEAGTEGEKFAEKLTRPLTKLREGFAPFLEGAGINAVAEGGLLGGLLGIGGPGAAIAALSAVAVHLAKVSEQADKTDKRLKGLGGGDKAFDQLEASAKKLGSDPDDLQGAFENFLSKRNKDRINHQRVVLAPEGYEPDPEAENGPQALGAGGRVVSGGATNEEFLAAQRTLLLGAQVDHTKSEKATAAVNKFLDDVLSKVPTGDALRSLQIASPADANRAGRLFGYSGADTAASYFDRHETTVDPRLAIKQLASGEPEAAKDAQAARGVSEAFDGLKAKTFELNAAFGKAAGGPLNKALTKGIDTVSTGVGEAAEFVAGPGKKFVDTVVKDTLRGAEIGGDITGKIPIPGSRYPGAALGGFLGSDVGAVHGAFGPLVPTGDSTGGGLAKIQAQELKLEALRPTGNFPLPPPAAPKAEDTAHIAEPVKRADVVPDGFTRDGPFVTKNAEPGFTHDGPFTVRTSDPIAASPAAVPPETQPRDERRSEAGPPPIVPVSYREPQPPPQFQQGPLPPQPPSAVQDIAGAVQGLINQLRERIVGPENNRIDTPTDAIGIRGEAPKNSAVTIADAGSDAKQGIQAAGADLSAALGDVANSIRRETVAAASGGLIQRFAEGGKVSGAGTSTSDGVKAALSDGEYVLKASAVDKIGDDNLNWMNAEAHANGGLIAKKLASVRKFADGGASTNDDAAEERKKQAEKQRAQREEERQEDDADREASREEEDETLAKEIAKRQDADNAAKNRDPVWQPNETKKLPHHSSFINDAHTAAGNARRRAEDENEFGGNWSTPPVDVTKVVEKERLEEERDKEQANKRQEQREKEDAAITKQREREDARNDDPAKSYADGGPISGAGTTTSDDIPAYLSHGEFVTNARETARNLPVLHAINNGDFPSRIANMFASGGRIELPRFADGGPVSMSELASIGGSSPSAVSGETAASNGSGELHHVDMRTNFGDFHVMAPEHIARGMGVAARDSANAQTGPRPSWYKGR